MLELFVFGTFWFWALVIVVGILELIFIEFEKVGWATFFVLVTLAALQFMGGMNIISWMYHNPLLVVTLAGGYFIVGAVWSIIKWVFHTMKVRREYDQLKIAFASRNRSLKEGTPEYKKGWKKYLEDYCGYNHNFERRLSPSNNKARITMWIAYWPFSALWTLIDDPVRRLVRAIFDSLHATYERISKWAMRGTENDLPEEIAEIDMDD